MSKVSILKTKLSLFTSVLSATTLVGVLWIFPSKSDSQKSSYKMYRKQQSIVWKKDNESKNIHSEEEEGSYYQVPVTKEIIDSEEVSSWEMNLGQEQNPFSTDSLYLQGDSFGSFRNGKVEVFGTFNRNARILGQMGLMGQTFDPYSLSVYQPQFRRVDINYKINSYLTANVKTNSLDANYFDDRVRVSPSTMAGLSFKGSKYISAGFLTGETKASSIRYWNQNGTLGYLNRDSEIREAGERRNIFEFQTNIYATKNFGFQTAIYNTNRASLNEIGASEGARVAMFLGFDQFMVNFRYNYSANDLSRGIRSIDSGTYSKDYAGIGITVFFDKFKNYSLFLGNNYHNVFAQNRYEEREARVAPAVSSFSASLRGVTPGSNAIFFLNFRNQMSRDTQYSNIGLFRLPTQNLYMFEFATALGMEVSF